MLRLSPSASARVAKECLLFQFRNNRHAFAVRALESTLSAERRDVGRHVLTLSTYLGHSNTADTYWYLEATPVLLRQVSKWRWRH